MMRITIELGKIELARSSWQDRTGKIELGSRQCSLAD